MQWQEILTIRDWDAQVPALEPAKSGISKLFSKAPTPDAELAAIRTALQQYHLLDKRLLVDRVVALQKIARLCVAYESPTPRKSAFVQRLGEAATGKYRYLSQVTHYTNTFTYTQGTGAALLQRITNLLLAPGARSLRPEYWIESFDPCHRAGTMMSAFRVFYFRWLQEAESGRTNHSFLVWLEYQAGAMQEAVIQLGGDSYVAYLDGRQRVACMVTILGDGSCTYVDPMTRSTQPFDTSTWRSTGFDGMGAFVMGTDGVLYAHEHVENEFHHSSFLSGGPVLGAGMIAAKDGLITRIIDKSGHYRPRFEDLSRVVALLDSKGALGNAEIEVKFGGVVKPGTYTAQQILQAARGVKEEAAARVIQRAFRARRPKQ